MGFFVRRVASAFLSTPRKGGGGYSLEWSYLNPAAFIISWRFSVHMCATQPTKTPPAKSPRKQQAHQAYKRKRVVILYMYICRVQRFVPDYIDSYILTFGSYYSLKKFVIFSCRQPACHLTKLSRAGIIWGRKIANLFYSVETKNLFFSHFTGVPCGNGNAVAFLTKKWMYIVQIYILILDTVLKLGSFDPFSCATPF
jgi:hypothetical protein